MQYNNDDLGVSFVIADAVTVGSQLRYRAALLERQGENDMFLRLWRGLCEVATDWQCEHVALYANLNEITSPKAARVISWAGLRASEHMNALEDVPKN
jgi:hypothetical protein